MARKPRSPGRKKQKPARKPKAAKAPKARAAKARAGTTPARTTQADAPPTAEESAEVVDLRQKKLEQLTTEIIALSQSMAAALDSKVALIVGAYRQWERAHPQQALKPKHKLPMVRLGFIGPGGYQRCHEPHRLPDAAFEDDQVRFDNEASEIVMCPAMEDDLCEGVWRGMSMPPCCLLLLEVNHAMGGGVLDDGVQWVVDDWGKWHGPEHHADSFARARELVEKHRWRWE